MLYDVIIVGGGPAGLSAALALARARKRVLLCDSGPRRNAAAVHVQNFLTRDGTPPDELRAIAREQLGSYPQVQVRDLLVAGVSGSRGDFRAQAGGETFSARRILLSMGMVDELLPLDGFRELWGHSIFQCPYCHGWEVREKVWGFIASRPEEMHFPLLMRGWTNDVVVFTQGMFEPSEDVRSNLSQADVKVESIPIRRLQREGDWLTKVELSDGREVACDFLFAHPPQRQVSLITQLNLTLDEAGYVRVDEMSRETSVPGIFAAGDLTTFKQSAIVAAASGMQAAAALNHELTTQLVTGKEPRP